MELLKDGKYNESINVKKDRDHAASENKKNNGSNFGTEVILEVHVF